MEHQDATRVRKAVLQGRKETDFLILLVNRTNAMVLEQIHYLWLKIALIFERLSRLDRSSESHAASWEADFRECAADILSIEVATQMISSRYFNEESILLDETVEGMKLPVFLVRGLIEIVDSKLGELGYPELVIRTSSFSRVIDERAANKASTIAALAKGRMLADFGDIQAANTVLEYCLQEPLDPA